MRVFVTGASGFVGGWLSSELSARGHVAIAAPPSFDMLDGQRLQTWFTGAQGPPEAVVHLAAVSFASDARRDPAHAFNVNVAGTSMLFESLRGAHIRPIVLVAGSSEVYGSPTPQDLPIRESAPLAPRHPYAVSKLAQEAVAIEAAAVHEFPVVVVRAFNHTGPRQRDDFVVPALAKRILAVKRHEAETVPVGNIDVLRDIGDVRDVVRAYRMLIEAAAAGSLAPITIVNVATGRSVSIRSIVDQLSEIAEIEPTLELDTSLVRPNDPVEIRGDPSLISQMIGWRAEIPLRTTLTDVWHELNRRGPAEHETSEVAKSQAAEGR